MPVAAAAAPEPTLRAYYPSPSEKLKYALTERLRSVLPRSSADKLAESAGFVASMFDPVEAVRAFDQSANDFRTGVENRNFGQAGLGLATGVLGVAPVPGAQGGAKAGSKVAEVLAERQAPRLGMSRPNSFLGVTSSPNPDIEKFDWRANLGRGLGDFWFTPGTYVSVGSGNPSLTNVYQTYGKWKRKDELLSNGKRLQTPTSLAEDDNTTGAILELSNIVKPFLKDPAPTTISKQEVARQLDNSINERISALVANQARDFISPEWAQASIAHLEEKRKLAHQILDTELAAQKRVIGRTRYLVRVNSPIEEFIDWDARFKDTQAYKAIVDILEQAINKNAPDKLEWFYNRRSDLLKQKRNLISESTKFKLGNKLIDDLAMLSTNPQEVYKAFNKATKDPMWAREISEAIAQQTGAPGVRYYTGKDRYKASPTKVLAELRERKAAWWSNQKDFGRKMSYLMREAKANQGRNVVVYDDNLIDILKKQVPNEHTKVIPIK